MATINSNQESQKFKQIEGDGWLSGYLPAICAGTLMAAVLFVAVSCSKKSEKQVAKISAPESAAAAPAPAPTPALPETPKKIRKHRPANATYVNTTYGVSFSYPRKYSLQAGDKKGAAPVQSNFVKPGAVQVAAVDMPDDSYPETDFSSALFNVSVIPGMTADECMQFGSPSKDAGEVKPTTVKLGANEFSEFEQISGEGDRKSDLKYFRLFKNNACYEFVLDVDTAAKPDSDLAQVDRGKVFQKLEKILATARIKDVELPGVENAETTPAPPAAEGKADAKSEKAQVVTPEQK